MSERAVLKELVGHNVIKRGEDEGDVLQIAEMKLIWKARGPGTAYQFSIYEMDLQPNTGIPLHKHPYAEFFKVLAGEVSFAKLNEDGPMEWVTCKAGDSVLAPPNTPHTFHNKSSGSARFMSVSTYYHESMFITATTQADFSGSASADPAAAFGRFVQAAEQAQVYVVEG